MRQQNRSVLERIVGALNKHAAWSQVANWTVTFKRDPKWHRKDRLRILKQGGDEACTLHFATRRDGTGLSFSHDREKNWHTLVMTDGWDREAAASALLACVASHAVPGRLQRGLTSYDSSKNEWTSNEIKDVQNKIRKSKRGWEDDGRWPPCVRAALEILERRYAQLTGVDVQEAIQRLEDPFRFLLANKVPFERVERAWREAECAEVLKS